MQNLTPFGEVFLPLPLMFYSQYNIAVVAVLAAVTIVSYRGVTQAATRDAITSDLKSRASLAARALVKNSVGTKTFASVGITQPEDSTMNCRIIDTTFCASILKNAQTFHITEENEIKTGGCPALPAVPGIPQVAPTVSTTGTRQIVEYTGGYLEAYNPRIKWSVGPFTSARCGASSNFYKTDAASLQACNISRCSTQLKFRIMDPLNES